MGSRQIRNKGEFILLAIFALFTIAFIVDISDLPIEGRILSYLLAPFILGLLCFCFYRSFFSTTTDKDLQKYETGLLHDREEIEYQQNETGPGDHKADEEKTETRLYHAIALACILLLGIFFLGFYIGSGFMLLLWFLVFKKLNMKTIGITVATPLLLFVIFELLIGFGLYEGLIFVYIGR